MQENLKHGYEREAFYAAINGPFKFYEAWRYAFFTCQDCGEDTSKVVIHHCKFRPNASQLKLNFGE
jgi:hypothetical protein